jgi:FHA domain-containing protein/uncharacterized protein DUF1707
MIPGMRASDRARERTVALLRRRCAEGYLSLDTYERRVEQVLHARDSEQLAGLTADLPAVGLVARLRQWRLGSGGAAPEALRLPLELVRDRLTLGRSRYCDVVVDHDTVSRRHAELWRDGDRCYVTDLGSSNGTWVGGRPVEGERRVRSGDQILLGGCLVVVL